jgi:hypothetical protein
MDMKRERERGKEREIEREGEREMTEGESVREREIFKEQQEGCIKMKEKV